MAAFVEKHQELIGSVTIEGIDLPFDISREYVEEVAGKYLAAVAEAADGEDPPAQPLVQRLRDH